jgi:hypothetical protein
MENAGDERVVLAGNERMGNASYQGTTSVVPKERRFVAASRLQPATHSLPSPEANSRSNYSGFRHVVP